MKPRMNIITIGTSRAAPIRFRLSGRPPGGGLAPGVLGAFPGFATWFRIIGAGGTVVDSGYDTGGSSALEERIAVLRGQLESVRVACHQMVDRLEEARGRVHSRVYFEPTRSVAYALAV
jgi:hypothetical protein